MNKSFEQKTASTQKLKSSKPRLRFIKEREDLSGRAVLNERGEARDARAGEPQNARTGETRDALVEARTTNDSADAKRWAEQVISDGERKLEVKAARWIPAFSLVALVACGVFLLVVSNQVPDTGPMFLVMGVVILLLSTMFFGMVFRVRPLYEIDQRGIIDHGLATRGFGLIEWKNIQSVRTYEEKGSTSLLVKVDNFNELLERRNLLLRPFLWIGGMLCAILGGEITLAMTTSNQPQSLILERMSHFSRQSGRDVVVPKRGFVKEVSARATLLVFFLILFSIIGLFGLDLYKQWLPHLNPKLEILGAPYSLPTEVPVKKSVWLGDVIVQNYGGDSRGIKVELSGLSFDKGLLTQPRILVSYDEKPEDLQHVRPRTRELLTLREEKKNFWTATSAVANMPHKDDTFMDTIKFVAPNGQSMLKQDIGWWTDTTSPNLTVEIFADAIKKGRGSVTLKVVPLACPSKAVSQTLPIKNDKISTYDMPLYSVSVPKDYPISLYPGGQIIWLSRNDFKFDSDAQPMQIATYYEKELQQRGWKSSTKEEKSSIELTARNGQAEMTIRINRLPGHSPVWITL